MISQTMALKDHPGIPIEVSLSVVASVSGTGLYGVPHFSLRNPKVDRNKSVDRVFMRIYLMVPI